MLFPKKVKHRKWQVMRRSEEKLNSPDTRGVTVSFGSVTQKPAEVGMGSGKGDPQYFMFEVAPGRILFEIDGVSEEVAKEAFRKATAKLPLKAKFVRRNETRV